jgi:thiol:disulfide interchange protein DsbD
MPLLFAALTAAPASASPTTTAASKHVRATLAPEATSVQPGRAFHVGVRLEMEKDWHTYWKNPGDSGLPTRIRWTLPEGFETSDIQWPRPQRFPTEALMSYGYAGEVWLLTQVRPPARLAAAEVVLSARVDWLECKEACLPGRAELSIVLPVKHTPPEQAEHAVTIDRARARVPRAARFTANARATPSELKLEVRAARPRDAYFFPVKASVIEHALPQKLEPAPAGFGLSLPRAANGTLPKELEGVLELDGAAFEVVIPIETHVGYRSSGSRRDPGKE